MTENKDKEEVVKKVETPEWIPVQRLRVANNLALVQWTDAGNQQRRGWIPEDSLKNMPDSGTGMVADRPERGIPYGDDFANLIEFKASGQAFENALHARNIWTYDELKSVVDVQVALQAAYALDTSAVLEVVRQQRMKKNQEN